MHTAPPLLLNTLDDPTMVDEISTNNSTGNTLIDPMDIDQHKSDTTSISTSNSFRKRKLDIITSDEELNISGNLTPSSKPSPTTSEMPAKRRLPDYRYPLADPKTLCLRIPLSIPLSDEHSQQAPK
jgi:hypothetical protein